MRTETISIQTSSSFSCHAITNQIESIIECGTQLEGVVCVSGMHTTTALIVDEMEERLILDLEKWLKELAPPLQGYMHDDLGVTSPKTSLRTRTPICKPYCLVMM